MADVVLKVENLDRAIDAFRRMPDKFSKTMRLTMKKAVRDLKSYAQQNHLFTSRKGNLERSISSDVSDDPLTGVVFVDLGVAPYGIYVHEGTKPHSIFPKRKKALRWAQGGGFIFSKDVLHPGTEPDPFMTGAWEHYESKIPERFVRAVDMAIKEAGV